MILSVSEHHVPIIVLWGAVSFAEFMKGYNQLPTRMVSVSWHGGSNMLKRSMKSGKAMMSVLGNYLQGLLAFFSCVSEYEIWCCVMTCNV